MSELALEIATILRGGFASYHTQYKSITRRARQCFEQRDWTRNQQNAVARLQVYSDIVQRKVDDVHRLLEDDVDERTLWVEIKQHYKALIAERTDSELAETFFNSVTRRIFDTVGVAEDVEFIDSDVLPHPPPTDAVPVVCHGYTPTHYPSLSDMFRQLLTFCNFKASFIDLEHDAEQLAARISAEFNTITRIDVVKAVFFRSKAAYLIGRVLHADGIAPLVISFRHPSDGIRVDALLLHEDETSIVFSFAHTYFHVELDQPAALISFLKSLLPLKPVSELWISTGYNRHGKTVLYRELMRHLDKSDDKFMIAPGTPGMVMTVFTLPTHGLVFKIIKDKFDYPKTSTRKQVMQSYRMVFQHDRAGRLLDAQSFEHLEFDKARFEPDLLTKLLAEASDSVRVVGDKVAISFLYTTRKVTPLNLYLRGADETTAAKAALEYGQAIRELASTNIFPGDLFLKNFGVTRHGRVLFYDYDELAFVTDCNFRDIPQPPSWVDEMSSQVWYPVAENDVFPEQFVHFLGLKPTLKKRFLATHADLLTRTFWQEMQQRHRAGLLPDIFPYRPERRLNGVAQHVSAD